jgi:hypothetical protein
MDGDQMIASLERPIQVVRGILTERQALERRLAKIQGHESTKSTIRYVRVFADVNFGQIVFVDVADNPDFGEVRDGKQVQ